MKADLGQGDSRRVTVFVTGAAHRLFAVA